MLQNYGAAPRAAGRGGRVGRARAARPAARPRADRRQRGGRAHAAAAHRALPPAVIPDVAIDVRRVPARQIAVEVQQGSLDFGALTFHPARARAARGDGRQRRARPAGAARAPARAAHVGDDGGGGGRAGRRAQRSVAGARARAAAVRAAAHRAARSSIALPSLDGIKRAVEMELGRGAAAAPLRGHRDSRAGGWSRCRCPASRRRRQVMLVCRKAHRSHAAEAFLAVAQAGERTPRGPRS